MRRQWKTPKVTLLIVAAVLPVVTSVAMFWFHHPTHIRYNDRFVLGSTAEEIQAHYGEFSQASTNDDGDLLVGRYLLEEADYSFLGYGLPRFYAVYFDEDDVAYKVETEYRDLAYKEPT